MLDELDEVVIEGRDNIKTFGVLTVDDILGKNSLVAVLGSRGYKVEVLAAHQASHETCFARYGATRSIP